MHQTIYQNGMISFQIVESFPFQSSQSINDDLIISKCFGNGFRDKIEAFALGELRYLRAIAVRVTRRGRKDWEEENYN